MSLKLAVELTNGVSGNYWRISEVIINFVGTSSVVVISQYLNKAAFLDGKQPIQTMQLQLNGTDFPFSSGQLANVVHTAYTKLQETAQFTGAIYAAD